MAEDEKKEMPFITKALIIGIMAIVVVVASAGISFFVVSRAVSRLDIPEREKGEVPEGTAAVAEKEIGLVVTFGEFTVNLNESMPRYLVCTIEFEFDASGRDEGKNARERIIGTNENPARLKVVAQDRILAILRSKSIADLNADSGLRKLRAEIMEEINPLIGGAGKLQNVYFSRWVIQ